MARNVLTFQGNLAATITTANTLHSQGRDKLWSLRLYLGH